MRVLCAFNVNIDGVCRVKAADLAPLVSQLKPQMPSRIESVSGLLEGLLACMKAGTGGELLIDSQTLARQVERSFSWDYRLGGNAGNMAQVLALMGMDPVLNVPSLTSRQACLLSPKVKIPRLQGQELVLVPPQEAARPGEDLVHFVFQFEEGEALETKQGWIVSPRENRLIATFDPLNRDLYQDPDFKAYWQRHLKDVDGALLSGFHLASVERHLKERLEEVRSWKEKRPEIYVHAEMASFPSTTMMRSLAERLQVDSLGMNDEELSVLVSEERSWEGVMAAARELREELGISRISVHTREYVLSVIKDFIPAQLEVEALATGVDVAASLASTGRVAPLFQNDLPLNPKGVEILRAFCKDLGASKSDQGAYLSRGGQSICMVPTRFVEKPRVVVGLGDAFTAAAYACEVAFLRK